MTTLTTEALANRAASRGYILHGSVTDERLARIHPRMLNGTPDRLTPQIAQHLDASCEQVEAWIEDGCRIAAGHLGGPGDEVIAPPTADPSLMLVMLPSFRVVATVTGSGERTDGESYSSREVTYTILAD